MQDSSEQADDVLRQCPASRVSNAHCTFDAIQLPVAAYPNQEPMRQIRARQNGSPVQLSTEIDAILRVLVLLGHNVQASFPRTAL
jgi:hypothetical protein